MSTDIVALEKQYAKLRRKQHHACVVISGIKPVRADTDVGKDKPTSPGGQPVLEDKESHVENSVAMVTLSVPLETEKSNQDLTDPISPTVFGDTRCFFVQNLKKKTKDKPHAKHSKRSTKTNKDLHEEKSSACENGNEITTNHADSSKKSNKKCKKVCFKDETETVNDKKRNDEDSHEGDHDVEPSSDNDECKEISENIEQRSETDSDDTKGECNTSARETVEVNGLREDVDVDTEVDTELDNTDTGANLQGIITDDQSKAESVSDRSGCEINDTVKNETPDEKEEELEKVVEADSTKTTSELSTNIVKTSRTQGIKNPSLKFSKQYYPSHQISHKKHRTKSESLENTNKQSIYQHFNLIKRQLSLDSALSGGNNKSTQAKSIDFPFPVHSINEHKIKTGMKLGLYDRTALEKLEKTRKIHKTKLPNLTFD